MKQTPGCALVRFSIVALSLWFGALPALAAQAGPQASPGTQLGQDPGRPMITVCTDAQPCQFVGLVDPGGAIVGGFLLDSGYFSVCTPGACVAPAPFALTPAFLAGTSVAAAAGGLSPAVVGTIVASSVVAVGGAIGGGIASQSGDEVQTGSQ